MNLFVEFKMTFITNSCKHLSKGICHVNTDVLPNNWEALVLSHAKHWQGQSACLLTFVVKPFVGQRICVPFRKHLRVHHQFRYVEEFVLLLRDSEHVFVFQLVLFRLNLSLRCTLMRDKRFFFCFSSQGFVKIVVDFVSEHFFVDFNSHLLLEINFE